MFNKLKQFKDLRTQAKTMQNALKDEMIEVEKKGIKVVMNGNMNVESITINSDVSKEEIGKITVDCMNEAIKKTQKVMAKQMQEMGGFPGLS